MKRSSESIDKWIASDPIDQTPNVFSFEQFRRFKEVKDMDLVDQRALWEKISKTYFNLLITEGKFNFKDLFTIRLAYGFFKKKTEPLRMKLAMVINDISCKKGLNKLSPILKILDEAKLQDDLL